MTPKDMDKVRMYRKQQELVDFLMWHKEQGDFMTTGFEVIAFRYLNDINWHNKKNK